MTICFDLRALQIGHENRGIGMYLRSLLENIEDHENKFIFYVYDSTNPIKKLNIDVKFDYEIITTPFVERIVKTPFDLINNYKNTNRNFVELSNVKPDVLVQFDHELGIPNWKNTKTFVIGYDLIPLIMKNQYNPGIARSWRNSSGIKQKLRAVVRSLYYKRKYSVAYKAYEKTDRVICISMSVATTFHEILGIDKNKLSVVPLAPVTTKNMAKMPQKLPGMPYLLYVGGTDARKQINHLVKAFNIVRGRGLEVALVLAGNEFESVKQIPDVAGRTAILNSAYNKDIHTIGFVSDEEKKYLYRHAYAFVFSSSYEGFGLPIVEAMAENTLAVTYKNSSIPEAGGDAAIYAENGNYVSLANKIIELNNLNRDDIIAKGVEQVKKFSWQTTAAETMEIIVSV